jgi:hypothetical protein
MYAKYANFGVLEELAMLATLVVEVAKRGAREGGGRQDAGASGGLGTQRSALSA